MCVVVSPAQPAHQEEEEMEEKEEGGLVCKMQKVDFILVMNKDFHSQRKVSELLLWLGKVFQLCHTLCADACRNDLYALRFPHWPLGVRVIFNTERPLIHLRFRSDWTPLMWNGTGDRNQN